MTAAQKKVNSEIRENEAIILYSSGLTYQEVADRLGYSDPSSAHRAVHRALRKRAEETFKDRDDLIVKHMEIIRMCVRGQMPAVVKGNPRAVEVVIKALERESKLLGLDKPIVADVRITDAMQQEINDLVQEFETVIQQRERAEENRARG